MPFFDACLYVEQRYEKRIEADTPEDAKRIANALTDKDWGEATSTTNEQIIVFNEDGDEIL